jgi:hypothetical protein
MGVTLKTMKRTISILLCLLISTISFSQKQTEKYSKARIFYNTPETYKALNNSGIPMDHGVHKKGVFIESDFSASELNTAKNLGATVEIIIDDVKKYYVERNKNAKGPTFKNNSCAGGSGSTPIVNPVNYNHGSMGGFMTYAEVMAEIDDMAAQYPNLITARAPIDTFTTHDGNNLFWVRMSDNANTDENEPEMLYDAVHHAREAISIHQMVFYMWYLLENYSTNTEIQAILDNTELYFVPFINPDGFLYNESTDPNGGGMWRKNRRDHQDAGNNFGVDNNRNYDYVDGANGSVWGTTGISFDPSSDTHCGPSAFSEPENQAMKWFVNQHEFKIALNNHSYSNLLLYPFGFETGRYCPDDADFVAISDAMVAENGFANSVGWELYATSGGSDDWMYGDTTEHSKIYSFTPEIGSGAQGFWPIEADIDPLCHGMLHLNLTAAHLLNNYAEAQDLQSLMIANQMGFLHYDLTRLDFFGTGNFTVTITPVTANIISIGSANTHNGMSFNQTDLDSISYTLSPSIAAGDLITYVITVDNGLFLMNDTITKIYGTQQTVLDDNADNLTNWAVSQTWAATNSTFYSASSSITDSPTGDYSNNINKTITLTNEIDLNGAITANMSFYAKWAIEAGWDYVQVEVSTDNGSNWIPQCGNYTKIGNEYQDENQPVYDGFQSTWVLEEIDLGDYINQNILVRFQIISDNYQTEDGFYFDDFKVNVVYGTTGINPINENNSFLGQSYPNPTNGNTTISYALAQNSKAATLNITNELGQVILQKELTQDASAITIPTSKMAAGVYYYFIDNDGSRSTTKKMMVVK